MNHQFIIIQMKDLLLRQKVVGQDQYKQIKH